MKKGTKKPILATEYAVNWIIACAILKFVADEFELPEKTIANQMVRTKKSVAPMAIAIYYTMKYTTLSLPEVGSMYNKCHTTIMYHKEQAVRHIMANREKCINIMKKIEQILRLIKPSIHAINLIHNDKGDCNHERISQTSVAKYSGRAGVSHHRN